MSDVINGVSRELLERAERNLCSGEEAYRTQQDLRAVLTAQPQSSAAQSAPDEREAFEAAHRLAFGKRVVIAGYEDAPYKKLPGGDYADVDVNDEWVMWQAGAAWQRAQSAPAGAVGWQFYQDGKWWNGDDRIRDHRANTEAAGYPVRDVYAAPQPAVDENFSTTSDRYRAELYDEVWQKARDMGYGNVTEALLALERAKAQPAARQEQGDKYDEVLLPFLTMMRAELHANAGKGDRPGWLAMDRKTALLEIFYHLGKLQKATKDGDQAGIREYSADVANMAMMLADICGVLTTGSEHKA